ncbi:unnamed protein product [Protopolystoma xenopodis]|uniref:Uncharacterized protein n=1 Tax=Protopolystoma xenopodis TaxID=117903 RepID=A0A3S5BQV0_9PLAT|nr:unnamed protein product [Protopolystoma xenopodis]
MAFLMPCICTLIVTPSPVHVHKRRTTPKQPVDVALGWTACGAHNEPSRNWLQDSGRNGVEMDCLFILSNSAVIYVTREEANNNAHLLTPRCLSTVPRECTNWPDPIGDSSGSPSILDGRTNRQTDKRTDDLKTAVRLLDSDLALSVSGKLARSCMAKREVAVIDSRRWRPKMSFAPSGSHERP